MKDKKIREILAKLYWQGHEDGSLRMMKKNKTIDYGIANISIESASIQLGCKPNTSDCIELLAKEKRNERKSFN